MLTAQDGPPMFMAPSMIADWYGPQMPSPMPGRAWHAGLVDDGVPRDGQDDGVGMPGVQVDQQHVVGITGARLGLLPNPLPWPFLVCDPSRRMFCTP